VAACLQHVTGTRWGTRMYMDAQRLHKVKKKEILIIAWKKWRGLECGKDRVVDHSPNPLDPAS